MAKPLGYRGRVAREMGKWMLGGTREVPERFSSRIGLEVG